MYVTYIMIYSGQVLNILLHEVQHGSLFRLLDETKTKRMSSFYRVAPDLTFSNPAGAGSGRIWELKSGRSRIWLKLVFGSHNNTPVIKLMASTILSAAIEAVQFSASFVVLLFASVYKICRIAMHFVFFAYSCVTRIPVL